MGFALDQLRVTRVNLAAAHLDHDPANSAPSNLRSLCQRCHLFHDRLYLGAAMADLSHAMGYRRPFPRSLRARLMGASS